MSRSVRSLTLALATFSCVAGLATVLTPATAASFPSYTHPTVDVTGNVMQTLPGRVGLFHNIRVSALNSDYTARPEQPQPLYVAITDYNCPTTHTLSRFVNNPGACTQVGSTVATAPQSLLTPGGVISERLVVDVVAQTAAGGAVAVDFAVDVPLTNQDTFAEEQVIADSTYTWKVIAGLGGLGTPSGTVAGISMTSSATARWTASAYWDQFLASAWKPGLGAPHDLGWRLKDRASSGAQVKFSRTGKWGQLPGNFHVGDLYVDSDDYQAGLDPVTSYQCTTPATADFADPVSSGCVEVGSTGTSGSLVNPGVRFGRSAKARFAGDLGFLRVSYLGAPDLIVDAASLSVWANGPCSIDGQPTIDDSLVSLQVNFRSTKLTVHECTLRQAAVYDQP